MVYLKVKCDCGREYDVVEGEYFVCTRCGRKLEFKLMENVGVYIFVGIMKERR